MVRLIIAAAVVAVAATFAWTAAAGGPPGPVQDRVYGGGSLPAGTCTSGPDVFCSQISREYSVFAIANPQGSGAYGTITFGTPDSGQTSLTVRVNCLAVSGNTAVVAGIVTSYIDPTFVGYTFRLFVRDLGTPGSFTRDGVSANFFDDSAQPAACSDVGTDGFGAGYFALAHGDFTVEDR
jgi:hypothetical protein